MLEIILFPRQRHDNSPRGTRIVTPHSCPLIGGSSDLDSKLEWLEKPENRACQVKSVCSKKGLDAPEEEWPAIIDTATSEMVRFENAFKHWISILRVERMLYLLCALFQYEGVRPFSITAGGKVMAKGFTPRAAIGFFSARAGNCSGSTFSSFTLASLPQPLPLNRV